MRKTININRGWQFNKQGKTQTVDLPHTWNAVDGQEGADYYRGRCVYSKILPKLSGTTYLEVNAANSVAGVKLNGKEVGSHRGGYSMFRFDLTPYLTNGENKLEIAVDNSDFEDIYPSMADFTFYGGLYRDVNLITDLGEAYFSPLKGRQGIFVTPSVKNGRACLTVEAYTLGETANLTVRHQLFDAKGECVGELLAETDERIQMLEFFNPILWDGVKNPYLYTLSSSLIKEGKETDRVETKVGFRTIEFDSEKGCFLNGEPIKLKGVCRHQDRLHMGNALTKKEHEEDLELILEVGANSVRLAHYQQDEYFYNLCDEAGLLVWAEVPVISRFSQAKQENAKSQLTELIEQNYNHTSVYAWGIQNEITIGGKAKGMEEALKELNALAKSLDPSRPTVSAQVMMYATSGPLNKITDILGYNIYYGWYMKTAAEIGGWLDDFHKNNPQLKLCLSEYGAEGILRYQNEKGVQGDYSETYQAYFHEIYAREIEKRDWLWGSYVWNMFDFGAANRDEGGVKGRNNKGLVTIDRKTRKDSFYVYKAYWTDEPFVHIGGERYARRPVGKSTIVVYSNAPKVSLTVNGESFEKDCERVVRFEGIEIKEGENTLVASVSGADEHEIKIQGTQSPNPDYVLPKGAFSMVRNWFVEEGDGADYFSLDDRLGALLKNEEVKGLLNSEIVQQAIGGKKGILNVFLTLARPFKLKSLLKAIPLEQGMKDAAESFITTLKK